MRLKFKPWAAPYLEAHREVVIDKKELEGEEFKKVFDHDEIYLEIGSGRGDFIVELAKKYPERYFIAVEKSLAAAAVAVRKIVESEVKNIRFINQDVANVFPFIPEKSITTIFLNFSDPWPKKRHYKRRLTHEIGLNEYSRILKDNGEVRFKTDNGDLFEYSLANFKAANWKIAYLSYKYNGKDKFDAVSEYERGFRADGLPIMRLIAKKGVSNDGTNK